MADVKVNFYNQRRGIDEEKAFTLSLELDERDRTVQWENAYKDTLVFDRFSHIKHQSWPNFLLVPDMILNDKGLKNTIRELKNYLYQEEDLGLFRCRLQNWNLSVDESRSDFIVRLQDMLNDKKESEIEKLTARYLSKENTLNQRLIPC